MSRKGAREKGRVSGEEISYSRPAYVVYLCNAILSQAQVRQTPSLTSHKHPMHPRPVRKMGN